MAGLNHGPYASLDAALNEIETHTRGVCRMRRRKVDQQSPQRLQNKEISIADLA
jgi:hypothetical protein